MVPRLAYWETAVKTVAVEEVMSVPPLSVR
jgi:hypothetical protein